MKDQIILWSTCTLTRGYNPSYPFTRPFIGAPKITPVLTGSLLPHRVQGIFGILGCGFQSFKHVFFYRAKNMGGFDDEKNDDDDDDELEDSFDLW